MPTGTDASSLACGGIGNPGARTGTRAGVGVATSAWLGTLAAALTCAAISAAGFTDDDEEAEEADRGGEGGDAVGRPSAASSVSDSTTETSCAGGGWTTDGGFAGRGPPPALGIPGPDGRVVGVVGFVVGVVGFVVVVVEVVVVDGSVVVVVDGSVVVVVDGSVVGVVDGSVVGVVVGSVVGVVVGSSEIGGPLPFPFPLLPAHQTFGWSHDVASALACRKPASAANARRPTAERRTVIGAMPRIRGPLSIVVLARPPLLCRQEPESTLSA